MDFSNRWFYSVNTDFFGIFVKYTELKFIPMKIIFVK